MGEKYLAEQLVMFFQYGHADNATNRIDDYWGVGLRYNNWVKEDDAIGLGIANAKNGKPYLDQNLTLESAERTTELVYSIPVMRHLTVKSSLYYIENPSMAPDVDNALALGLRLYIAL